MCVAPHPAVPRRRFPASASRRRHRHTARLIFRVLATFVLALLVIVQVPSTGPEPSGVSGTPGGLPVTFRTDAAPPEISATGAQILESYGSFAVAPPTSRPRPRCPP